MRPERRFCALLPAGILLSMPFAFTLSADDYGYRPGVSAAIRRLAFAGRLSATSAIVNGFAFSEAAPFVPALRARIDVGLHLNLVEGRALGPMRRLAPSGLLPPLGDLVRMALTGAIEAQEIRDEVRRQIDAFTRAAGAPPDFLDGHQHAHALPGIGRAVLDALAESGLGHIPVRDPSDRLTRLLTRPAPKAKALVIAGLTRGFGRIARRRGVPTNDGFSGVYGFDAADPYALLMTRFLAQPGPRHLVMCHPGDSDDDPLSDPIRPARLREAAFLASSAFDDLLTVAEARLARFTELAA